MKLIRRLDEFPDALRGGAVSIGNFDGVHLGHARIVQRLLAHARQVAGPAVAFTLEPHPAEILRPQVPLPNLTTIGRKAELLARLGVDAVIAYPTDKALLQLSPQAFFDRVILDRLAPRAVVEGPSFFFGCDRAGDVNLLGQLCKSEGIILEIVEPCVFQGRVISSSRIRQAVAAGHVEPVRQMLTEPYRIVGRVVRGVGRGAKLGFPTANLEEITTLLPGQGIYAGRAFLEAATCPAAISVGPNWTFGEEVVKVEAHLLGYEGVLYGQNLAIDFLARLRDIIRFHSADELVAQLRHDVDATRRIASQP